MTLFLEKMVPSKLQRQPFKNREPESYVIKQQGTPFLVPQLPLLTGFYFKGALITRPLQPQIYCPILYH